MSAEGDRYLEDVRHLPCEICVGFYWVSPEPANTRVSHAHHPRTGAGAGRKNDDLDAIALCPRHHQDSNEAIHVLGRKAFERLFSVSEAQLTESTRRRVTAWREQRGW